MCDHHFLIMYSLIYFKYFCIVDIVLWHNLPWSWMLLHSQYDWYQLSTQYCSCNLFCCCLECKICDQFIYFFFLNNRCHLMTLIQCPKKKKKRKVRLKQTAVKFVIQCMFTQVHIEFRAVRLDKDDIISSNNLLALCNLIGIQDSVFEMPTLSFSL